MDQFFIPLVALAVKQHELCFNILRSTREEVRYQPTEYLPAFPMTFKVILDEFEFLHMFEHLWSYKFCPKSAIMC
jgi:hypothetical protein